MIDNECLSYTTISEELYKELSLLQIKIEERKVKGASEAMELVPIGEITYAILDVGSHERLAYFYVIPKLKRSIFLGLL